MRFNACYPIRLPKVQICDFWKILKFAKGCHHFRTQVIPNVCPFKKVFTVLPNFRNFCSIGYHFSD